MDTEKSTFKMANEEKYLFPTPYLPIFISFDFSFYF